MIEGSGAKYGSLPRTNGTGSGRPKTYGSGSGSTTLVPVHDFFGSVCCGWQVLEEAGVWSGDHRQTCQVIDRYRFMNLLPLTPAELKSIGYQVRGYSSIKRLLRRVPERYTYYLGIQGASGIVSRFLKWSPASSVSPIMTKFSQYHPHFSCYLVLVSICRQDKRDLGRRIRKQSLSK